MCNKKPFDILIFFLDAAVFYSSGMAACIM